MFQKLSKFHLHTGKLNLCIGTRRNKSTNPTRTFRAANDNVLWEIHSINLLLKPAVQEYFENIWKDHTAEFSLLQTNNRYMFNLNNLEIKFRATKSKIQQHAE